MRQPCSLESGNVQMMLMVLGRLQLQNLLRNMHPTVTYRHAPNLQILTMYQGFTSRVVACPEDSLQHTFCSYLHQPITTLQVT
jgi:hypothetical protein